MSKQDEFLKSQKILRLVTISEKGIPHVVPVWYIYSEKKFYIGTNTRTKKAKNLLRNKKVSFCIDTGIKSPDIYGIMGNANAKLIQEENTVNKIAKKILLRYFKSLENKSAKELLDDTDCIIEINPRKIVTWSY
ncbi:MAG: pyridoxamine 5'-phosphate oxidase family protein [Crenarchaeota archaeon]|nr:MAG: pyridoxamine 5'-phosphate oxidase family protein [Thermoproteota archaeon]RDJ33299.1 MAG: pyridoxamine 5'-phosphate oxidase family protein [Thermoproteota archaeon]RDJ36197.1 MAG: pyridoxamine 5'-phosphate oxidase family protein [Thermoproteota archaeon]RDJ38829.1 MAG: pyridoxamine 5'-phosphate oxidase family protein [Thermoproteota archaeon]